MSIFGKDHYIKFANDVFIAESEYYGSSLVSKITIRIMIM